MPLASSLTLDRAEHKSDPWQHETLCGENLKQQGRSVAPGYAQSSGVRK